MLKILPLGANQTQLSVGDNLILFSYKTPVAAWVSGRGWLRTSTKYSKTTTKHINKWLRGYAAQDVDQSVLDTLVGGI